MVSIHGQLLRDSDRQSMFEFVLPASTHVCLARHVVKTDRATALARAVNMNGGASSVSARLDMRTGSRRRDASRRGTTSSLSASHLPLDHP